MYEDGTKPNQFNIKKYIWIETFDQNYTKQMQTSLTAVKSFVVHSGLQGNSSQVVNLRKRLNFLISH